MTEESVAVTEEPQVSPLGPSPERRLMVIEIFGPTVQGEGALAGRITHFIRLGACDYRCGWCDSDHAVIPAKVRENGKRMTTGEIVEALAKLKGRPEWLTISGGNPALQECGELVEAAHALNFKVAVETQGSVWKDWLAQVDQLTVSPKPPSSNMDSKEHRLNLASFFEREQLTLGRPIGASTCIKVPVFDEKDYEWARHVHQRWARYPFFFSVVTRMGGLYGDFDGGKVDTKDDVIKRYRWLVERAVEDPDFGDVALFPQIHVLLWQHERQR